MPGARPRSAQQCLQLPGPFWPPGAARTRGAAALQRDPVPSGGGAAAVPHLLPPLFGLTAWSRSASPSRVVSGHPAVGLWGTQGAPSTRASELVWGFSVAGTGQPKEKHSGIRACRGAGLPPATGACCHLPLGAGGCDSRFVAARCHEGSWNTNGAGDTLRGAARSVQAQG